MKRLLAVAGAAIVLLYSVLVFAQVDPNAMGDKLVEAIGSKDILLGLAAGIMLLVWLLQRFVAPALKENKKLLPWIAVAIGLLSGFGTSVIDGSGWLQGLINGAVLAFTAMGQYDLLKALKKKDG